MSRRRFALSPERKALLAKKQATTAAETHPPPPPLTVESVTTHTDTHPPSSAQKRLWFLEQRGGVSALYNVPCAVRLRGALEPEKVRRALEIIVHRHESLRTTFRHRDGVPVCHVGPCLPLAMQHTPLLHGTPMQREAEALSLATKEARTPMNLEQGPLFRVHLLQLDEQDWVLLITLHHIITDGWSMGILQREFVSALTALQRGEEPTLPPLLSQPRASVALQEQALRGEAAAEALTWWSELLHKVPTLSLPQTSTDSSGAGAGSQGAHESIRWSLPLSARLRQLANARRVSLFMLLKASFVAMLSGISGQRDLAVGTPHANRETLAAEAMIGFFVNTLVFRYQWEPGASFSELLGQVRERTLEGFARREIPFERVVERTNPDRSLDQQPLFRVWFAVLAPEHAPAVFNYGFRSAVAASVQLPGVVMTPFPVESGVSKFDLAVLLWDSPEGLSGTLEYNSALLSPETIRAWSELWTALLESLSREENPSVEALAEPFAAWRRTQQATARASKESSLRGRLRKRKKTRPPTL